EAGWSDRWRDGADAGGDEVPRPSAARQAEGNADHQRDERERARLPGHHRGDLSALEPNRLENGEVPPPSTDRADERVGERGGREERDETREEVGQALDTVEVDDVLCGQRTQHGWAEVVLQAREGCRAGDPGGVAHSEEREHCR